MKCFNHPETDAVASCKHCYKGVCPNCAKNSGAGIVCSESCETEVKAIYAMVERNRKVHQFLPKMYLRGAVICTLMGVVFIAFGLFSGSSWLSAYLIAFGVVMFFSAGFALFNSRKMARFNRV